MRKLLIAFLLCCGSLSAQTIQNPSFETFNQLTNGTYNSGPIPNWTCSGGGQSGSWQPGSMFSNLPNGVTVAWLVSETCSQDVGQQPAGSYSLSAYVAHRPDGYVTTYTISLMSGTTTVCSQSGSNGTIPAGTWQQVSCSGNLSAAGDLTIVLASGGNQVDFDAVSFGPPPSLQATLTWTDSINPSGTPYNVYRSQGPSCTNFVRLNGSPVAALTYVDATIVRNQSYCYEVRAVIGAAESIAGDDLFLVVQ